jgi:hypothetical protein
MANGPFVWIVVMLGSAVFAKRNVIWMLLITSSIRSNKMDGAIEEIFQCPHCSIPCDIAFDGLNGDHDWGVIDKNGLEHCTMCDETVDENFAYNMAMRHADNTYLKEFEDARRAYNEKISAIKTKHMDRIEEIQKGNYMPCRICKGPSKNGLCQGCYDNDQADLELILSAVLPEEFPIYIDTQGNEHAEF